MPEQLRADQTNLPLASGLDTGVINTRTGGDPFPPCQGLTCAKAVERLRRFGRTCCQRAAHLRSGDSSLPNGPLGGRGPEAMAGPNFSWFPQIPRVRCKSRLISHTTGVGILECVSTLTVSLPRTTAAVPRRPCDAVTIRSHPFRLCNIYDRLMGMFMLNLKSRTQHQRCSHTPAFSKKLFSMSFSRMRRAPDSGFSKSLPTIRSGCSGGSKASCKPGTVLAAPSRALL